MLPIVILSLSGLVVLYLGFQKSQTLLLPATLLLIAVAFVANFLHWNDLPSLYYKSMLYENNLTLSFSGIILFSAFLLMALTRGFSNFENSQPAEYYSVMMFSLVGAIMMVGFQNLLMLFIGVEILSVSMYVLTGSDKRNTRSNEAALKYFLMGAFATGIMLFGMALMYGAVGSFDITALKNYVNSNVSAENNPVMLYMGLMLVLIGMLFKVSAAPFHFWTPDVYDGAPTIFTAFMSTIVKTAGFAALYRLLSESFNGAYSFWWTTIAVVTILTLLVSNITAAYQQNFKRMMAYSSISHAGYLLLALTALSGLSQHAIVFYSLAYSIATIGAFGVLMLVSEQKGDDFDAFNGLAKKNPLLAYVLTICLLSLAGIPLTAGFWGKFFTFSTAASKGLTWILVIAILMSAVGIYYYFKAIIAAFMKEGDMEAIRIAPFYKIVLIITAVLSIVLGVMPDFLRGII